MRDLRTRRSGLVDGVCAIREEIQDLLRDAVLRELIEAHNGPALRK